MILKMLHTSLNLSLNLLLQYLIEFIRTDKLKKITEKSKASL